MENEILKKMQTVIPTTKLALNQTALKLTQALENGEVDALDLLRTFKMMELLKETIKETLISTALSQASKYPEKELELHGCTFKKMEAGTKYDFSKCGDQTYELIMETAEKVKEEKEKREKFLKGIDGHITIENIDQNTGEVKNIDIYPPVKTSTSTIQVTLK